MGRPPRYTDATRLRLQAQGKSRLQTCSDRRAIVNLLVARGGVLTLAQIDKHFGFRIRDVALSLVRAGWCVVETP